MANLEFKASDIYTLASKLSSVANALTDKQWELLLAIFANAIEQIEPDPSKTRGTLPDAMLDGGLKKTKNANQEDLISQLHNAYVPGAPPPQPMIIRITPPRPQP